MEYGVRPPNYRLPDETRIGTVRLQVSDLAQSLRYYQQVLGLRVIEQDAGRAVLGAHDDDWRLLELHERRGARMVPRRGLLGLYHYAILLPDRASLGRFLKHLAALGVRAGMSDHLVSEALYLQDPDNLGIEVYADRPRDLWRHAGRQLELATEPLNAADVVAAAGNTEWAGMPAGTRIGHVHLHVGDIAAAESFYHAALGFEKVVWSYPGALFMSAGGYHHHLGTNTWAAGASAATDQDCRLLDWELLLPGQSNVEAAARSLRDAGHPVTQAGATYLAADPWGTKVRLLTL
jgi:catechol 2,3-dioxygenase